MPRAGCCPSQCPASRYCHSEGLSPSRRRGGGWWGLSLAQEEGEPTTSRKKPGRSWMKPFSHLDRGHRSSFDGSSLLPFEQSLADGAPDNTPIFCPALLASFLFAFPPSSPTSDGATLGWNGSDQVAGLSMAGALSPSKGTNKQPAVPNPAGGILRKYRSQHPRALLPPRSKASDAKKSFAAIRQRVHFQRASW